MTSTPQINICTYCGEPATYSENGKYYCLSCKDIYLDGHAIGYNLGYEEGYSQGAIDERMKTSI